MLLVSQSYISQFGYHISPITVLEVLAFCGCSCFSFKDVIFNNFLYSQKLKLHWWLIVNCVFIAVVFTSQGTAALEEMLWRYCQAGVHRCAGNHTHEEFGGRGGRTERHHLHSQGTRSGGKMAARAGDWHGGLLTQGNLISPSVALALCNSRVQGM